MSDAMVRVLPADMGDVRSFAADASKSAFSAFRQPADAMLAVLTGRDLGLSAAQSIRAFHVIEGKPTLSADAMVAVCVARRDLCAYFRTVQTTATECTCETQRVGEPSPRSLTYTIADAKAAGLAGRGTWQKHPAAMLRARAKSALARDTYPDLLLGIYDPSELDATEAPARAPELVREVVDADIIDAIPEAPESDERAAIQAESARESLMSAIASADTATKLGYLVTRIRSAGLDDSDLAAVREAYGARKRALTGAA